MIRRSPQFAPATLTIISLVILAACGSPDKQIQLDSLIKERAELDSKITALQAELGPVQNGPSGGKVFDVVTTAVKKAPFTHSVDVQGIIEADEAVELRPVAAGNVTKILVKEGDVVQRGQLLAETDNEIYVRQLNSLKPQLDLATELYDRQSRLWSQKIGSELQYLQAKTQKESLEKQIETIREQIELTRIKSPIQGTIDYVGLKLGQFAAANVIQPAFRIVNLRSLKAVAQVTESAGSRIRNGNVVALDFPDLGESAKARVTFTSRTIDPLTRTFTVHSNLPDNPGYRPNMVVVMRIVDYENTDAISIPVNLLQTGTEESFVYVATTSPAGKKLASKRIVQTGRIYGSRVEITSGLLDGDQLITSGYNQLVDGAEIKF